MDKKQTLLPITIIALLASALVCLISFRFCTSPKLSSSSSDAAKESDIAGQYEITQMVTDGEPTAPEDLELLKSKGLTCTITLRSDGTGTLNLFGEETSLTWDDKAMSTGTEDMTYTFHDGQLVIVSGDSSLTLLRTE